MKLKTTAHFSAREGVHKVIQIVANNSKSGDLASEVPAWTIYRGQFTVRARALSQRIKDIWCITCCTPGLGSQGLQRFRGRASGVIPFNFFRRNRPSKSNDSRLLQ